MPLSEIGQDRFQRRLTRELEIPGHQPAPVLAPEIQPVLVIESERTELLHLQHEHRFACTLTLNAVPAEYYYFHLWNPAGSGMLMVVESFAIEDTGAVAVFDMGVANLAFYAVLAGRASYCLDTRLPQNAIGRPGLGDPLVGTDPNTGGIAAFGRFRSTNNGNSNIINLNYVISPGTGFGIWNPVVNKTHSGFCIWRERPAKDGELT